MADVLATSEFRLSELKTERATLYLCLPATRLETYARWLRIIISQAVLAFKRTTAKPDIPTLLVLDYFASLGRLKAIEVPQALPSLGLRPWLLVNSLAEVKRELGDNWEAFVAQAGVQMVWSSADMTTLQFVSKRLGQVYHETKDGSVTCGPLASPSELEQMLDRDKRTLLVMATGQAPVILQRAVYYEDAALADLADG